MNWAQVENTYFLSLGLGCNDKFWAVAEAVKGCGFGCLAVILSVRRLRNGQSGQHRGRTAAAMRAVVEAIGKDGVKKNHQGIVGTQSGGKMVIGTQTGTTMTKNVTSLSLSGKPAGIKAGTGGMWRSR